VRVILNLAWHVPAVDPLVDAVVIEYPAAALLHNPLQRLFRHGLGAHVPALLPIPAGVDIDALKRSRTIVADGSTVVVGRISRLVAEKDPETFIAAAAVLLRRFETGRVRFVIYGDGDADAASRALAEELGLHPPHFEFRGHTEDVRGALEEMDVFAYSTSGDTAAFVVLEAMAMSLPIVSTKIDGVTALVDDGVNGFSVEQKDVLAFADAVDRLVRDGSLRQAMGAASRRMAEGKHDLKASVALYAEAYAEVAQTRYVRVTGPFGK
jgi:glycosyltransferase involved in cell wall biosynthesis